MENENKEQPEAIEVLQKASYKAPYFEYYSDNSIVIDGDFTLKELEAFLWLAKNEPQILKDWEWK